MKKLMYLFVVLVLGLLFMSACEQTVGRRIVNNNVRDGGQVQGNSQAQQINIGKSETGAKTYGDQGSGSNYVGCSANCPTGNDGEWYVSSASCSNSATGSDASSNSQTCICDECPNPNCRCEGGESEKKWLLFLFF